MARHSVKIFTDLMLKVASLSTALILSVFVFGLERDSLAQCDCVIRDPTALAEYDGATAVLVGEILSIQNGERDRNYRYVQTVTMRVERAWKRDIPSIITLRNEIHGCINGWKVGDRYLVYAHANKDGETYSNGCCCSRTTRLDRVDGDLESFAKAGFQEASILGREMNPPIGELKLTEVDLTVNGIRSGMPYSTIVNKIGKPTRQRSAGVNECSDDMGRMKDLSYPGLKIGVLGDSRGRNYEVISIEVTSASGSSHPASESEPIGSPFLKPSANPLTPTPRPPIELTT